MDEVVGKIRLDEVVGKIRERIDGWKARLLSNGARLLLIKIVLSSIPIHILSILRGPKSVIVSLNRCFGNFFWGMKEGKPKKHWRAWDLLCKLVQEGGVGIRSLADVQKALHMKFAWKILTENSLRSRFFKGKYVESNHISLVNLTKGTRFWRMAIKSIPWIIEHSKWKVKNGELSFWLGEDALGAHLPTIGSHRLQVKECFLESGCDLDMLNSLVGPVKAEEIANLLSKRKEGEDILVWTTKDDGKFSTRSAWECLHVKTPKQILASWIWHSSLPKNIVTTMWKAMNIALSVDDKVRKVEILVVSRCNCCAQGAYEDQSHVLATGEVAQFIWSRCAAFVGLQHESNRSWWNTVEFWFTKAAKSSTMGQLIGLIRSIITWKLWSRRCKVLMEDAVESAAQS